MLDNVCLIDLFLLVLVWLAFANLLPAAAAVSAFLVVTVVSVAAVTFVVAVVVGVGTIVEVLKRVSGSTVRTIVSHRSTSKQVYFLKPLKKVKEVTVLRF